jgi:hypothetical protein
VCGSGQGIVLEVVAALSVTLWLMCAAAPVPLSSLFKTVGSVTNHVGGSLLPCVEAVTVPGGYTHAMFWQVAPVGQHEVPH